MFWAKRLQTPRRLSGLGRNNYRGSYCGQSVLDLPAQGQRKKWGTLKEFVSPARAGEPLRASYLKPSLLQ
jgi:hypothetical protein